MYAVSIIVKTLVVILLMLNMAVTFASVGKARRSLTSSAASWHAVTIAALIVAVVADDWSWAGV